MKNTMIEAFELKRQGYYKQAVEVYYKLLSETGDNIEILTELADLYFLMKNTSKSMNYIEKVLEMNPDHVQALKILMKMQVGKSDFASAIESAKHIYAVDNSLSSKLTLLNLLFELGKYEEVCGYEFEPEDSEGLILKSKSLYELKRYDEAMEILAGLDDNNTQVLLLTGKICYKKGLTDKAREVSKKLENIDLNDSESLNFVGLNYIDELELDKSIECFKKAIELKEDNADYYYNLGQAYFLKGWIEEAQKSFNTAICLNPMSEEYHYSLAYLLYRIGDYNGAILHLNEDNLNSKILKLVIQAEQGDLAIPKIELEKLLKDHPKNETILFSLAKIYFKLDMFKQSKTIMEDVLAINSKSFEYQEFFIKLLLQLGELDSAKMKIDELLEKYPKYYYLKVLEAEYYTLVKEYDDLFETAQELIELDMNHFEGYYFNAVALFEKDDVNFAIESLKKAITLDVNNASLYVKMGEFYQAIGRYEDALAYVKEASDIDKSAKNRELYIQLSTIVRKHNMESV